MIHSPDDYLNYALIYCLAIAGNNLLNIIRVRKYVKFEKINIQSLRKHIKPVFTLLIASIAVEIYVMVDTTMLGFYCNNVIVGCYSNAMKLTRMVNTTAAAIGAVLLPRLSRLYEDNDKKRFNSLVNSAIKIMLTIAIPAMVGIIFLSDYIVLLFFGDTFYEAIPILKILSLMIPIVVCNTVLGGQVLVTCNMENKYVFTVVIASVVNVILNGLFIPIYGATSAAFASLISEIIDFILYLWFTRKIIRIKISPKFIISITIPLVIYLLFANNFIMPIFSTPILIVAINIIACVLIYFGLAALMGNESVIFILSKITSIIKRKCVKYENGPCKKDTRKKEVKPQNWDSELQSPFIVVNC